MARTTKPTTEQKQARIQAEERIAREARLPRNSDGTTPAVQAAIGRPRNLRPNAVPLGPTGDPLDQSVTIRANKLLTASKKSNQQAAAAQKATRTAPVARTSKEPVMASKSKGTKAKVAAVKKAVKQLNKCECGCGAQVAGTFKQGHDARFKGMLLRGEVKSPSAFAVAFAKRHGFKIGQNKPKKKAA